MKRKTASKRKSPPPAPKPSAPARAGLRIMTPEEEKDLPTAEGLLLGTGETKEERVLREVDELLNRELSR